MKPIRSSITSILFLLGAFTASLVAEPPRPEAPTSVIRIADVGYGVDGQIKLPPTAGVNFVVGRDNLAFSNITGAVASAPGDCYAFTMTSKFFFEKGAFQPGGNPERGFNMSDLVHHLDGNRQEALRVEGYESLFDMTLAPELTESRAMDLLNGTAAELDGKKPLDVLKGREKMKYQIILFLNILQNLMQSRSDLDDGIRLGALDLLSKLRGETAGPESLEAATQRLISQEIRQIMQIIASGHVCPMAMMSVNSKGGHAILAYKYVLTDDHVDIYVYDSNVQYASERGESILRVSLDGSEHSYHKQAAGGAIAPDGIYNSSTWFTDETGFMVTHLNEPSSELLGQIASTVAFADQANLFMQSTDRFLSNLGKETMTLLAVIRQFILDIQDDHRAAGLNLISETERIRPESDAVAVNAFLVQHVQVAVRAVAPHALPFGMTLDRVRLEVDPADENRGTLSARLVVSDRSPLPAVLGSIEQAGLLMGDENLAMWIRAVRDRFGDVSASVAFEMRLHKGASAASASNLPGELQGLASIQPELTRFHGTLGRISASSESTFIQGGDFRVEIGEDVLQGALQAATDRTGLFTKVLRIKGGGNGHVNSDVAVTRVELNLAGGAPPAARSGSITVSTDIHTRVNTDWGTLRVGAAPLTAEFRINHDPRTQDGRINMSGRLQGQLEMNDGWANIAAGTALDIARSNNDILRRTVNRILKDTLTKHVFGIDLVEFDGITASTKRISAVTGWSTVDLEAIANRFLSINVPLHLKQFHIHSDRIVVAAEHQAGG